MPYLQSLEFTLLEGPNWSIVNEKFSVDLKIEKGSLALLVLNWIIYIYPLSGIEMNKFTAIWTNQIQ